MRDNGFHFIFSCKCLPLWFPRLLRESQSPRRESTVPRKETRQKRRSSRCRTPPVCPNGQAELAFFGCLRMSPAYLHLSTSFIFPKACRKPLFSYFLPLSYFLPCALSTWETEVVAFCRTLHSPVPSGADE